MHLARRARPATTDRRIRRGRCIRALVLALVVGSSALAQGTSASSSGPPPAAGPAAGEVRIREGLELRRQGHDREALEVFRAAYQLSPSPRALVQMAMAEQALGQWVEADRHLRDGLSAANDPWIRANAPALQGARDVIARHVGSLQVDANVAGAEIWVDDRHVADIPIAEPLRVIAGSVVVELRHPGYSSVRRTVEVESGGLARERFVLVVRERLADSGGFPALSSPPPPPLVVSSSPPPTDAPRPLPRPARVPLASIVLASAGGASLVAAGVFVALRQFSMSDCMIDANNTDQLVCATQTAATRARRDGPVFTTLTNVALATSAALIVSAGLWYVLGRDTSLPDTRARANGTHWTFDCTASGWFIGLRGSL